jgi:hypothetical protein
VIVKTRAEVRALVTRRARIVNHLNGHPSASLNIDIDDSYRTMRDYVTLRKWGTYLKTTGSLVLSTTPPTGENYIALPVPTDCRLVKRVETLYGTQWLPEDEVGSGQIRDHAFWPNGVSSRGNRFIWALFDQGIAATDTTNTGAVTAGVIALAPVPSSAGHYQIWYLPEHADLSADSGAGGFYAYGTQAMLDYHVFHAALKCVTSDNDSDGLMTGLTLLLGKAEASLENGAPTASGARTWRRARNYW